MKKMKWISLLLFIVFAFNACKKENKDIPPIVIPPIPPSIINNPPVANAGLNQTITLSSCYGVTASAELDGSQSFDVDSNIINYSWREINSNYLPYSASHVKALAEKLVPGEYAFELTVKDKGGLFSKDTVVIHVKASPEKHDLDLSLQSTYILEDNYKYIDWDLYEIYEDIVLINGKVNVLPIGEFEWYISQSTDTAVGNSTIIYNSMKLYVDKFNGASIYGYSTVNFKELIIQGGGTFNGTFKITSGTANNCDAAILNNQAPLTITGSLDVVTKKVNLKIQGEVYF
jgi:hypothetical protein